MHPLPLFVRITVLPAELRVVRAERSDLDQRREKVAAVKALYLMQKFGGGPIVVASGKSRPEVRSGQSAGRAAGNMTACQAAKQRHHTENKLKCESKARYKEEKGLLKPAPKLVAPRSIEQLVSSNRKMKKPTAEEVFESISD